MNELVETYNQFSEMTEQFSIRNFKYLMKHIGLFGDACLAALKMFLPVLFVGVGAGYVCGKISSKSTGFRIFMEGPAYAISALAVVSLLFIHFMFAVMFQLNANPFITIPTAFTLMNMAMVSRVVEANLNYGHDKKSLIRYLISGLIMTQSTLFNTILFLTLIIVTDIFEIKTSMNFANGAVPKNNTREIYGAFIIFFGITAYIIHYTSISLKKFFTDVTSDNND